MTNNTCITEGCTKEVHIKKRGLCQSHYQAWRRVNAPRVGVQRCSMDNCNGYVIARGYCQNHYVKWRKYGNVNGTYVTDWAGAICVECDKPVYARTRCQAHYMDWWKRNTVSTFNPDHHNAKDVCGYDSAHYRVKRQRGKASDYNCLDCGGSATDWALKHDANKQVEVSDNKDTNGRMYSLDAYDYEPRCHACHFAYDTKHENRKGSPGVKKVSA